MSSTNNNDIPNIIAEYYLKYISKKGEIFDYIYLFKKYKMSLYVESSELWSPVNKNYENYIVRANEYIQVNTSSTLFKMDKSKKILKVYDYLGPEPSWKRNRTRETLNIFFISHDIELIGKIKKLDRNSQKTNIVQLKTKKVREYFIPIFLDLMNNANFQSDYIDKILQNKKYTNNEI